MPVEIRELVIRAEVGTGRGEAGQTAEGTAGAKDRERLVRDCVEQVMELIRQKEER
mgnify:CR=1 FL=1